MNRLATRLAVFGVLFLFAFPACAEYRPSRVVPPAPQREYRAAWIASVGNINWPSTNSLTSAQQRTELVGMLDAAVRLRLNAVFLQVRPSCDALYASKLEPWSEYLTGVMGKAPSPYYDPLEFAIHEAHQRGLELHAWFNPYRARSASAKSPVSRNHVSLSRPQLVRSYGRQLWLDPGEREVQDYSISVIMDVVNRYDLDGVHLDDYFYPYREQDAAGRPLNFPDERSWRKYGIRSGLGRDDWRRRNVDQFVSRLYKTIKGAKPWVRFGISPFGIWRPGQPAQIRGFDAWGELYADSKKWLENGWVDYLAPQLYWPIDPPQQSFPALLKWWTAQNPKGRLIIAGMDATKVGGAWKPEEILRQIVLTRQQPGASGQVFWNIRSVTRRPELESALRRESYLEAALPPATTWLSARAPAKPELRVLGTQKVSATWKSPDSGKIQFWVLQSKSPTGWQTRILPAAQREFDFGTATPEAVAITAVNRFGLSSVPSAWEQGSTSK